MKDTQEGLSTSPPAPAGASYRGHGTPHSQAPVAH